MYLQKFFLCLLLLALQSCVGSDTTFLPDTLDQAKREGLLINIFEPSLRTVKINKTEYFLENAYTSFKFNSKNDLRINKNFFAFIIKLKNVKTGEQELSTEDFIDYPKYINFNSDQGGIHDSHLSIIYEDISKRKNLDTITIGFNDFSGKETKIKFIKKK